MSPEMLNNNTLWYYCHFWLFYSTTLILEMIHNSFVNLNDGKAASPIQLGYHVDGAIRSKVPDPAESNDGGRSSRGRRRGC